jgi:hypothetical protein
VSFRRRDVMGTHAKRDHHRNRTAIVWLSGSKEGKQKEEPALLEL